MHYRQKQNGIIKDTYIWKVMQSKKRNLRFSLVFKSKSQKINQWDISMHAMGGEWINYSLRKSLFSPKTICSLFWHFENVLMIFPFKYLRNLRESIFVILRALFKCILAGQH